MNTLKKIGLILLAIGFILMMITVIFGHEESGQITKCYDKYSNEIISVRKEEFESKKIYKVQKEEELIFDIIEILDTYYGKKFAKILKIDDRTYIKPDKFKKLITYSSKLDLNLHIINNTN